MTRHDNPLLSQQRLISTSWSSWHKPCPWSCCRATPTLIDQRLAQAPPPHVLHSLQSQPLRSGHEARLTQPLSRRRWTSPVMLSRRPLRQGRQRLAPCQTSPTLARHSTPHQHTFNTLQGRQGTAAPKRSVPKAVASSPAREATATSEPLEGLNYGDGTVGLLLLNEQM